MKHFYKKLGQDWFSYPELYKGMVNRFGDGSHFVEVGSWKGRSAAFLAVEIHNSGKRIRLDCVDTWEGSEEHRVEGSDSYEPLLKIKDGLYNAFIRNIKPVKKIINPIRMTSVEASGIYDDESLDFVFIDAAHDYTSVKTDIRHWLPKVRKGGVLSGHDYSWGPEVKQAVDEFFSNEELIESEGCWIHNKK
jgi:hypothetical protein